MANEHSITGVVYKIDFQEIRGKKDPLKTYPKYLFTLEVTDSRDMSKNERKGYKTATEFPQLEAFGMDLSQFAVGDLIEARFRLQGKEYDKRDGTKGHMTKPVITYMKYADLDQGYPNHKGKITIDSPIDPKGERKELDRVFSPPSENDEEFKDLPFMVAVLMGLSTLFPFIG